MSYLRIGRQPDRYYNDDHRRDRDKSRHRYGGGGGGGGGYGGGGRPREGEIYKVKTNFFPINVELPSKGSWHMYHVDIFDAIRKKKVGADGQFIEPWEFQVVKKEYKGVPKQLKLEKGGNAKSRRTILALLEKFRSAAAAADGDGGQVFAFDGGNKIVSPQPLFDVVSGAVAEADVAKVGGGASSSYGPYGPADEAGSVQPIESAPASTRRYDVRVLQSCEEDDPEKDRVRYEWKIVELKEVGEVPYAVVCQIASGETAFTLAPHASDEEKKQRFDQLQLVRQCMDIIFKNSALFVGMNVLGKSDRVFYFPENAQQGLLTPQFLQTCGVNKAIHVGLRPVIRIAERGGIYLTADSDIDFVDLDKTARGDPIPILDIHRRTIANICVGSLHQMITDPSKRKQIEEALSRLTFNVRYTRALKPEFEKRMRDKGKTDQEIQRMRLEVRKNVKMKRIAWAADDPNEHHFEIKPLRRPKRTEGDVPEDGEAKPPEQPPPPLIQQTVHGYFRDRHGVVLDFPKMPLISIGKNKGGIEEWFPVEFFSQAFSKTKDATEKLQASLKYNDLHAGTRSVGQVENLLRRFNEMAMHGVTQNDFLRRFGMNLEIEPKQFNSKVIEEPDLLFEDGGATISNGSFGLADGRKAKRFSCPADIHSFALVSHVDEHQTNKYFATLFKRMDDHGIINKTSLKLFDRGQPGSAVTELITYRYSGSRTSQEIEQGVDDAVSRARKFFLYDERRYYRSRKIWFRTLHRDENGTVSEILIVPPPDGVNERRVGVIMPHHDGPTHNITNPEDGNRYPAKIMVEVHGRGLFDPFDFRFNPSTGKHQIKDGNGPWENITAQVRHVYQLKNGTLLIHGQNFQEAPEPIIICNESAVECPSMVFVLKRDDDAQDYGAIKMVAEAEHGLPCQCAAASKFSAQRNPEQYCSNLAIKINAKLASNLNRAMAWNTRYWKDGTFVNNVPWVGDMPTLVIGITTASGIGQSAITIVSGSVALSPNCMQLAHDVRIMGRQELIHSQHLKAMIKTLTIHFYKHNNGEKPQRLLFIRDALSEGNLSRVFEHEMSCIRAGLLDFFRETRPEFTCNNELCGGKHGCTFCTVPITYLLCQSQHNVKVVPEDESNSVKRNVHSGTCIGGDQLKLLSGTGLNSNNFILTAQGGSKGTSKPVVYRVLENENERHVPQSSSSSDASLALTHDVLEKCIYHMSFQYTTATKAVRLPPVIGYSKRAADTIMKYINGLRDVRGREALLTQHVPEREDGEDEVRGSDEVDESNYFLIRAEMSDRLSEARRESEDSAMPTDAELCQLLPKFGPFAGPGGKWTTPFRHHFSA